jgi:hypothetical protein
MGTECWFQARSSSRVFHESSQALNEHESDYYKLALDHRINDKKQNHYYYKYEKRNGLML